MDEDGCWFRNLELGNNDPRDLVHGIVKEGIIQHGELLDSKKNEVSLPRLPDDEETIERARRCQRKQPQPGHQIIRSYLILAFFEILVLM